MEDSMFFIPKSNYQQVNLTNDYQKILESLNNNETYKASSMRGGVGRIKPFDVAESLEVAEHFEVKYAQNFINLLTSLSYIIIFSAAIPLQGGTHHVNEQPPAYWANLFASNDYVCYDFIILNFGTMQIYNWYRQNILVIAHKM
ncbi:hypothetical protein [Helicobacter ibis]|nr:hypothetical protein [Helicobacter ibis]